MDFNFPEKKGTGIERLIPHADVELVELMKKLIRYDPDDRILARQALKDNYFRELREAEKDVVSAGAPLHPSVGDTARSRDSRANTVKANMSSSGSVVSAGDHNDSAPENTGHEAVEGEERSGGLPTIRQEKRERAAQKNSGPVPEVESDDATEAGAEGTVLPPIGGLKGKRDSKQKPITTLKNVGASTLQKPMAIHGGPVKGHHFTGMSGSGATGSTGMSSGDPMSSTNPHSWAGGKNTEPLRSVSPGSGTAMTNKMHSTWAPHGEKTSTQHRRYVSPSGAKIVPGKGR